MLSKRNPSTSHFCLNHLDYGGQSLEVLAIGGIAFLPQALAMNALSPILSKTTPFSSRAPEALRPSARGSDSLAPWKAFPSHGLGAAWALSSGGSVLWQEIEV